MTHRMLCAVCAEEDQLEVIRILADDATPQLLLRCTRHRPPFEQTIDDPETPRPSSHARGSPLRVVGLVHQLNLYDRLAETVATFDRPVEYGVVEHHFAYAYPDDYRELYREFGHVHMDGSLRFSLSAYLSRLLGNLTRQGRVQHHQTMGTGRWSYNNERDFGVVLGGSIRPEIDPVLGRIRRRAGMGSASMASRRVAP